MPQIVKFHLFLIQSRTPSNPNKKILSDEHQVYFHFIILCLFLHYFLSICRVIIHRWDFSYCFSKQRSNFKGPRRLEHDSVTAVKSQVKPLGTQSLFLSLQTRQASLLHRGQLQVHGEINEVCGTRMGKVKFSIAADTTAKRGHWGWGGGTSYRRRRVHQIATSIPLTGGSELVERGQGPAYRL